METIGSVVVETVAALHVLTFFVEIASEAAELFRTFTTFTVYIERLWMKCRE